MECKNEFETLYMEQGYKQVIGIDEAGRGPLAGPLVVAGVCFPKGFSHPDIYDSKKVGEKKRKVLFDYIQEHALYFKIEIIDEATIDRLNIYEATKQTMMKIARECEIADVILSDAMKFQIEGKVVEPIVKGDQKSVNIAAASILAKVTRDRIMKAYSETYPEYGFDKNKGYPTKQHLQALETYGVLPIHRRSYAPVAKALQMHFDFK